MTKEVSELRKYYEQKLIDLVKQLGDEKKKNLVDRETQKISQNAEIDGLKKTHTNQMNLTKEDFQKRESQMKEDFLNEKEKIREDLEKKLKDKEKSLESTSNTSTRVIEDLKRGYEKKIDFLQVEIDSITKNSSQVTMDMAVMKKNLKGISTYI